MLKQSKKVLLTIVGSMGLVACGGSGGGSNPTASVPTTATSVVPAGPAVVKMGPITGFGSVFVDGERFETSDSDTDYRVDDDPVDEDDLKIGMIVRVRSTTTNAAGEWIADNVEFDESLKGPVDSIGADSFVALGQTINIQPETFFDDGLTLSSIAVSDVVEVSGFRNETDQIEATYIERKSGGVVDEYEVLGQVRGLDAGAMTFQIGGLTVDYSDAEMDDLGSGLADGLLVEVEDENLAYVAGDLLMAATKVEGEFAVEFKDEDDDDRDGDGISDSDDDDGDDDRDEFEVVGLVTEVVSDTVFMIGAVEVRYDNSTEFSRGLAADIQPGVRLEVEGDLSDGNVLIADEIEFEDNEVRVSGLVNEIDLETGWIVVMGVSVDVSAAELEDDLTDEEPFSLSDLIVGDFVELEGAESGDVVVAEELERDEVDDSELRGVIDNFDETAGTVTILGQLLNTTAQTEYEVDDVRISAAEFFSRLHVGQTVVDADWQGAQADTVTAVRELSVED